MTPSSPEAAERMALDLIDGARSPEALYELAPRLRVLRFLAGEPASVRIGARLLQRKGEIPGELRSGALAAVMESLGRPAFEFEA